MLDIELYKECEQYARPTLPPWHIPTHSYFLFPFDEGFNLTSLPALRVLLNGGSDADFSAFMEDLGGLSSVESKQLLSALTDVVRYQQSSFFNAKPVVPVSNALRYFNIAKKILGINPTAKSLLEIESGLSLLPFALKHTLPQVEMYCSIERNSTLYLAQHYINLFLHGKRFDQRLLSQVEESLYPVEKKERSAEESAFDPKPRSPIGVDKSKRAFQIPWWQTGELDRVDLKFDVVVSTSNLQSVDPGALPTYLDKIKRTLSSDGILFAQGINDTAACYTKPVNPHNLLKGVYEAGFAPLFIALDSHKKSAPEWKVSKTTEALDRVRPCKLACPYMVLITNNHPLFQKYYDVDNFRDYFCAEEKNIVDTFLCKSDGARSYSQRELAEQLRSDLVAEADTPPWRSNQ